jgi:hypothetical protein
LALTPQECEAAHERMAAIGAEIDEIDASLEANPDPLDASMHVRRAELLRERIGLALQITRSINRS